MVVVVVMVVSTNSTGIHFANPTPWEGITFASQLCPRAFRIKLAEVPRATPVWQPDFGMRSCGKTFEEIRQESRERQNVLHTDPFFSSIFFCSEGCTSLITKSRTSIIRIHINQNKLQSSSLRNRWCVCWGTNTLAAPYSMESALFEFFRAISPS